MGFPLYTSAILASIGGAPDLFPGGAAGDIGYHQAIAGNSTSGIGLIAAASYGFGWSRGAAAAPGGFVGLVLIRGRRRAAFFIPNNVIG